MYEKILNVFVRYLPLVIVAFGWELAVRSGAVSPDVMPRFSSVAITLWHLFALPNFQFDAWVSIYQTAIGFSLAVLGGVAIGVGMARIRAIELGLRSILSLWYPIPVVTLFPLMALVLKLGDRLQISIIVLGSILPVIVTTFNAARGVDRHLVWSALNMGTSPHRVLWKVIIRAASPEILGGVRITLALSFVLMVASQQLGASSGLGAFTLLAGQNGFYSGMFAGILVVALMGFFADRLYLAVTRHLLAWQEQS